MVAGHCTETAAGGGSSAQYTLAGLPTGTGPIICLRWFDDGAAGGGGASAPSAPVVALPTPGHRLAFGCNWPLFAVCSRPLTVALHGFGFDDSSQPGTRAPLHQSAPARIRRARFHYGVILFHRARSNTSSTTTTTRARPRDALDNQGQQHTTGDHNAVRMGATLAVPARVDRRFDRR